MAIEFDEGRGNINKNNLIKVLVAQDGLWLKVIALHKDKTKVIGVILNQPITIEKYNWGDFVLAQEIDEKRIPEVISKIPYVPNKEAEEWEILDIEEKEVGDSSQD